MEHGLAAAVALDEACECRHRHHLVTDPVGQVDQHTRRQTSKRRHGAKLRDVDPQAGWLSNAQMKMATAIIKMVAIEKQ